MLLVVNKNIHLQQQKCPLTTTISILLMMITIVVLHTLLHYQNLRWHNMMALAKKRGQMQFKVLVVAKLTTICLLTMLCAIL